MTSKARMKSLADDIEDAEVASMLEAQSHSGSDHGQWLKDKSGDLDWAYTARNIRSMSHDELLTDLWEKAFSIPPREYNPSAPFVYVKMNNGEVITLPHGYRLPLMFVARYYWGITLSKVKDVSLWKKERANVYHLSRLCENLFQRARAKAFAGGMEKGWRCVMFDRLLARFYKSWYRNDPAAGKEFETKFSVKEYDRDVLKHDWKRWCTRGLNGVRMKEQEVADGITVHGFRAGLERVGNGEWILNGERLAWIADDEGFSWSSESELTEFDLDDDEEEEEEEEGEGEVEGSDADAEGDLVGDDDDGLTIQTTAPPDSEDSPAKRVRDLPIDEDEIERASKRARIEMISDSSHRRYKVNNIYALTRTLAAMDKNPIWANTTTSGASGSGSGSQLPSETIDLTSPTNSSGPVASSSFLSPPRVNITPGFSGSISQLSITPVAGSTPKAANILLSTPSNGEERPNSPKSSVALSLPKPKSSIPRRFSSLSGMKNASSASASSSKLPSSSSLSRRRPRRSGKDSSISSLLRPSGSKPRQTRASQIAGVATVNVYVSDGKPRGGAVAHAAARAARKAAEKDRAQSVSSDSSGSRSPSPSPSVSQPNPPSISPPSTLSPSPITEPTSTEVADIEQPPSTQIGPPPAKWAAPSVPPPSVRAVSKPKPTEPVQSETRPTYSQEFITSEALKLLVNLVNSSRNEGDKVLAAAVSSSSAAAGPSNTTTPPSGANNQPLEGRFQHLEGRFLSVKEELVGIVERLQVLENEGREQREAQKEVNERVLHDQNVDCRPEGMSQSVQTDLGAGEVQDEDVEMEIGGVEKEAGEGGGEHQVTKVMEPQVVQPVRVMGEIAIQTEQEEDMGQSHTSALVQSAARQHTDEGHNLNQSGSASIDTHTSDRNCGSETDTDSTLNAAKDEPIDPRAAEMSSNLSLLVNNLVSVKMLSLVGDMVKGKAKESSVVDPDASIRSMSPTITQSSDSFALSNLFEEIKAMKDEARAKDHRDKEEMLAMRQLHSAEVDALRRRLSYLESQNRYLDSGSTSNDRYRSSSAHADGHGAYHISAPVLADHHSDGGRNSRQRHPYPSASGRVHHSPAGGEDHAPASASVNGVGVGTSSSSSNHMPTPAHSERSFSFTRPGAERDDDLPLPIKSQRKHNVFARATNFG